MRRITTTLALALCLLGCDSVVPPWDRVELSIYGSAGGCSTLASNYLVLIADPTYGTAAGDGTKAYGSAFPGGGRIWWPEGYTGRRIGAEVVVYGSDGKEVARTGRQYVMSPPFDLSATGQRIAVCYLEPCDNACKQNLDGPSGQAGDRWRPY